MAHGTIDRIEQTLDTLRPYIASHRGQVEVVDFDEGGRDPAAAARRNLPRLRRLDGDPRQGIESPTPGDGAGGQARGGGLSGRFARGPSTAALARDSESPAWRTICSRPG